jgi:hypothetical protein
MSVQIDLNHRPNTYWPEALDREQLLSRIQGESRRAIARDILATEGFAGLNTFFAREILDDEDRRHWGLVHPQCMGGEHLPQLGIEDVEIARISLASVTGDQISIRARRAGEKIRYEVCDEYESEFELALTQSEQPLTLGELIQLIDGSRNREEEQSGGLLVCHWENMVEWAESLDNAIAFAWVQSAWYPELSTYYAQVASDWCEAKRKQQPDLYDDYDEEACA